MTQTPLEVILTHEHTDFDALASLLAASLLYPNAVPVLPRRLSRSVHDFVDTYGQHFPFCQAKDVPRRHVDRAIFVDTDGANWVKGMDEKTKHFIIDHHPRDPDEPVNGHIWHETLGANTTILLERIIELGLSVSPMQATLMALGIHADTGSLTYAVTTGRDAQCLAWLLHEDRRADLQIISEYLHFPLSPAQRRLLDSLHENSEFVEIASHPVLLAHANAVNFHDEFSTLAGHVRDAYELDAVFLLFQKKQMVQVVLRSTTDAIHVGDIARAIGGDGHARAAAAPVRHHSPSEVRARILELLHQQVRAPATDAEAAQATATGLCVRHIMSRGRPKALSPEMTVDAALRLMRRYGHEGFPVMQAPEPHAGEANAEEASAAPPHSANLLGLVTRRELDRAFDHGLGDKPLRRFMRRGPVTVRPDDALDYVRTRMAESGWGQIPVADESGQIIGIVTRTDLIRSGSQTAQPPYHAETVIKQLHKILSPWHLFLLRLLGSEAAQLDYAAYVVGGFVRDVLLGEVAGRVATLDVDIVIEGDAIAFAQRIQQRYGGRVVTHKRFGTANWLLHDRDEPLDRDALRAVSHAADEVAEGTLNAPDEPLHLQILPSHLDFATARTEFYTAPTALPTVERGNIKLDLYRRDFTINTLAICLNPERWGELLDFYGGLNDLDRNIVRVLHSLSFVDDPTRILRAVRYEQRFGFRIEAHTQDLLRDSLSLLQRVTGTRIRHELERTLQEEAPEEAFQRLDELGVLTQLHPQLHMDDWIRDRFVRLRRARNGQAGAADDGANDATQSATIPELRQALQDTPVERLYWCLLVYQMPAESDEILSERLGLRKETQRLLADLRTIQDHLAELTADSLSPSHTVALLDPVEPAALALVDVAYDNDRLRRRFRRYLTEWRHSKPLLDGHDLRAMGIQQGPIYKEILSALRTARLDGEIETRAEEVEIVRRMVD